jgi:hypothetical protein
MTGPVAGLDKQMIYNNAGAAGGAEVYYVGGNVGIGTTGPLAKFSVVDGAILASGTTGDTPASGAGTRMMWIPAKSAFRAGSVDGTQWDDANVGDSSTAMGYDTKASGYMSTAMGVQTTANGEQSTAMGQNTKASGQFSTAMGEYTSASGQASTAMGYLTTASGWYSTAMGTETTAGGQYSTAMGYKTTASGKNSTSMGYYTTAQPYASLVIGQYNVVSGTTTSWVATEPVFVIGNGASSGSPSNALTVLKNGNVGIGTTNPQATLDVNGTAKIAKTLTASQDAGVTLTAADFGKTITVNSGSDQIVNLPDISAADIGGMFTIIKLGSGKVTAQAAAGDVIANSGSGGTIYNNVAGDTYVNITLRVAADGKWVMAGGHGTWITTN